jgi:hypothetical protein
LSFPLVGNPSVSEERFQASQNDEVKDLKKSFFEFLAQLLFYLVLEVENRDKPGPARISTQKRGITFYNMVTNGG